MFLVCVLLSACERRGEPKSSKETEAAGREVVAYIALDREFAEPILSDFTARTGIAVQAVYDTESTKSLGLASRIRAEANRPRCDVHWNNEILHTLRLKQEGLLQPCRPAEAENCLAEFRDPDGYWYGFAARARVLVVNTDLVTPADMPTSITDLAAPTWKGRAALAKPLFGTTASHVACLFASLGEEKARSLLAAMRGNQVVVAGGNKACAEMVAAGRVALALTDTDDALGELDAGKPVRIIWPDQGEGQMGTLLLPNTVALVKDCPHPAAGQRLIEYLLTADVEAKLAQGPSGQIPLHRAGKLISRVGDWRDKHLLRVDFARAAAAFPAAARYIEDEFLAP
jgi:iron(III) transport system substrate-binding protein